MHELTAEWVAKAEGDFATAGRELHVSDCPNFDAVCFHAQQMAEKFLKAFLQESSASVPKTHNLIALLELCLPFDASFEVQRDNLILLDRYAVLYHYPGDSADEVEARAAHEAAQQFRSHMCRKLELRTE